MKQSDYEAHTGTPAGKFVVGLGQDEMAFVDGSEDINRLVLGCVYVCTLLCKSFCSIMMNAVHGLLTKFAILTPKSTPLFRFNRPSSTGMAFPRKTSVVSKSALKL